MISAIPYNKITVCTKYKKMIGMLFISSEIF